MSNKITFTSTIVDGVEKTSAEFAYDTLNDITNDASKKKLGITPSGNKDITTTTQTDVTEYATAQVVDTDLIAENIKKDVDILGVTGSYEGIEPTGNINITSMQQVDVTNYATAQVVDANLVAENIKKDTTILGVTGSLDTPEETYQSLLSETFGS